MAAVIGDAQSGGVQLHANIAYREAQGCDPSLNMLDVYQSPAWTNGARRVVVFLHGGSWSGGDKACFENLEKGLPGWFVRQGCVFVSVNFRLPGNPRSPEAVVPDMLDDLAKALKWLSINARRYGGKPTEFVLLGYSSGAHLAALLASDASYLRRYRMSPADLRGVIGMDVPHYDLPAAMSYLEREDAGLTQQPRRLAGLYKLFSADPGNQTTFSPMAHVGPGLRGIAFLLLSAGRYQGQPQSFSRRMTEVFLRRLSSEGVAAEHLHFDQAEHAELVQGLRQDVAEALSRFLVRLRGPERAV